MSAIVCGKRSFFEDIDAAASSPNSASPPAYKKFRCSSSTSPVRFTYSPPVQSSPVDQLKALFPDTEIQLLEKALEEAGNDLDLAVKSLYKLCLGYSKGNSALLLKKMQLWRTRSYAFTLHAQRMGTWLIAHGLLSEPQAQNNLPVDGAEWVELIVNEMKSATSIDDARSRAASVLECLEKSISSRASAEVAQSFHKENLMLKEQIDAYFSEIMSSSNVLYPSSMNAKKEYDMKNQEVEQLKQVLAHYQEQLRTLEVNNYALTLHLRQAQQSNSIPGRFNPDEVESDDEEESVGGEEESESNDKVIIRKRKHVMITKRNKVTIRKRKRK
ncbi:hypothetical protein DH2020_041371 [Rehmannia glutinosa]|uniref:CUE domain-containing protein n=1 Tax=Rehmannia glutinosa TaxID=99300 RepID=A0ABR0URV9_REHGL